MINESFENPILTLSKTKSLANRCFYQVCNFNDSMLIIYKSTFFDPDSFAVILLKLGVWSRVLDNASVYTNIQIYFPKLNSKI